VAAEHQVRCRAPIGHLGGVAKPAQRVMTKRHVDDFRLRFQGYALKGASDEPPVILTDVIVLVSNPRRVDAVMTSSRLPSGRDLGVHIGDSALMSQPNASANSLYASKGLSSSALA